MDIPKLYPLPTYKEGETHMRGPTQCSNWVIKGLVLCGEYPGDAKEDRHVGNLMTYAQEGVTTYVCLQEDKELQRQVFRPYFKDACGIMDVLLDGARSSSNPALKYVQFPIEDGCIASSDKAMFDFVMELVERITENGEVLYIHCWAGRGRTGMIVACLLGIIYKISAYEALERTNAYFQQREITYGDSPEYAHQKMQVVRVVKMAEALAVAEQ